MIDLDKMDVSNYLMDYIKTLIEVNYIDSFLIRVSKFVFSLSMEELLDKELIKCFRILLEEFDLMSIDSRALFLHEIGI
jgi:hypothetical protein